MDRAVTAVSLLAALAWTQPLDPPATPRATCFRGWTGPDSGGSCSFDSGSMCDWSNVEGNDLNWEVTGRGRAKLSPSWWSGAQEGRLRGPALCGPPGDGGQACLQVRFRFSSGGGSRLTLDLCGQRVTCTRLFRHLYAGDTGWQVEAVRFDGGGSFELFLVGEKYEDTFGGESDIIVDYISYNSTACWEEATRLTSTTTTTTTTTSFPSTGSTSASEGSTSAEGDGQKGGRRTTDDEGGDDSGDEDESSLTVVIIGVSVVLVVLMVVAVVVAVLLVRRRHRRRPSPPLKEKTAAASTATATTATTTATTTPTSTTQPSSARYERNESVLLVTNQLYTCVGQTPAMRFEEADTSTNRPQARPSTTATLTSPARTSRGRDVHHKSPAKRPLSSPPRVITRQDDDGTELQTILAAIDPPKVQEPDRGEDQIYENAETEAADDKAVYENADSHGDEEDRPLYENDGSEPAAAGAGKADETYEKMEVENTEYSHLSDAGKRPDRRRNNYDRLK